MANTNGFWVNMAAQDTMLTELPPRLKAWVLYDAPYSVCLKQLTDLLAQGYTENSLLWGLRSSQRQNTLEFYGAAHPQACLV